ncbi:hypothetical protein [Halobacteriovorax sp. ZH4_bin.1]|uniref:hypothetical protein n=1 Tax=unclassified Halobacteriovorax TaxID=2639665 RepID=UPI00371AEFA9
MKSRNQMKFNYYIIPILDIAVSIVIGFYIADYFLDTIFFKVAVTMINSFLLFKSKLCFLLVLPFSNFLSEKASEFSEEIMMSLPAYNTYEALNNLAEKYRSEELFKLNESVYRAVINDMNLKQSLRKEGRTIDGFLVSVVAVGVAESIESGQYHVYRGLLSMKGEDMLKIYDELINMRLVLNDITYDKADELNTLLKNNLLMVG